MTRDGRAYWRRACRHLRLPALAHLLPHGLRAAASASPWPFGPVVEAAQSGVLCSNGAASVRLRWVVLATSALAAAFVVTAALCAASIFNMQNAAVKIQSAARGSRACTLRHALIYLRADHPSARAPPRLHALGCRGCHPSRRARPHRVQACHNHPPMAAAPTPSPEPQLPPFAALSSSGGFSADTPLASSNSEKHHRLRLALMIDSGFSHGTDVEVRPTRGVHD